MLKVDEKFSPRFVSTEIFLFYQNMVLTDLKKENEIILEFSVKIVLLLNFF